MRRPLACRAPAHASPDCGKLCSLLCTCNRSVTIHGRGVARGAGGGGCKGRRLPRRIHLRLFFAHFGVAKVASELCATCNRDKVLPRPQPPAPAPAPAQTLTPVRQEAEAWQGITFVASRARTH